MSTEFHEGDLVEAVKGETVIRGRLRVDDGYYGGMRAGEGQASFSVGWFGNCVKDGFKVAVIEKAAPKLPTEPGWYESEAFPLGTEAGYEPYALTTSGEWYTSDWKPLTPEDMRRQGKLHRLERESVTAKRVADALFNGIRGTHGQKVNGDACYIGRNIEYVFKKVRAEFGVE